MYDGRYGAERTKVADFVFPPQVQNIEHWSGSTLFSLYKKEDGAKLQPKLTVRKFGCSKESHLAINTAPPTVLILEYVTSHWLSSWHTPTMHGAFLNMGEILPFKSQWKDISQLWY